MNASPEELASQAQGDVKMLTTAEAAERLGVATKTLSGFIKKGRLPGSVLINDPMPKWLIPETALRVAEASRSAASYKMQEMRKNRQWAPKAKPKAEAKKHKVDAKVIGAAQPGDALLTFTEAAELTGVSRSHIDKLARTGKMPVIRPEDGPQLVARSELEKLELRPYKKKDPNGNGKVQGRKPRLGVYELIDSLRANLRELEIALENEEKAKEQAVVEALQGAFQRKHRKR